MDGRALPGGERGGKEEIWGGGLKTRFDVDLYSFGKDTSSSEAL